MTLTPLQTMICALVLVLAGVVLYVIGQDVAGAGLVGIGIGLVPRSGAVAPPEPAKPLTAPPPPG